MPGGVRGGVYLGFRADPLVGGRLKFKICDMSDADLDGVAVIEEASFPTPWSREMFSEDFRRPFSRSIVAKGLAGEILGYAVCWNIAGESHLLNIAVHSDFRGRGIGEALLMATIHQGRRAGSKQIYLEVRAANEQAQALYRKCGFVFAGIRKGYYTDTGEDALLFSREIRPTDAA